MKKLMRLIGLVPRSDLKEKALYLFGHPSMYCEYRNAYNSKKGKHYTHGFTSLDMNKRLSRIFNKNLSLASTHSIIADLKMESKIIEVALSSDGLVIYQGV